VIERQEKSGFEVHTAPHPGESLGHNIPGDPGGQANTAPLVYAAKSGNTNSYCYPSEIGGLGTEFSCFPNMGRCHKAQEVDLSASGECIILRSLDGELE